MPKEAPERLRINQRWRLRAFATAIGAAMILLAAGSVPGTELLSIAGGSTQPPLPPAPSRGTAPELPRALPLLPNGYSQQVRVAAGGNLQSAINSATAGTEILLAPGATYSGPFVLPNRKDEGWVRIATDLPSVASDARIDTTVDFARLVSSDNGNTVGIGQGADGWELSILEITPSSAYQNRPVSAHFAGADVADRLLLDRIYVHPRTAADAVSGCVLGNASNFTLRYSVLIDCHNPGQQTAATSAWNTPGPWRLHDNLLAAPSQGVLLGGARGVYNHPQDVTIQRNHFWTPPKYKKGWANLAAIETKDVKRILVEDNVIEGNFTGLLFKTASQNGACGQGCGTEHVTARYNVLTDISGRAITLLRRTKGQPGVPMTDILFDQNLIENIGPASPNWKGEGWVMLILGAPDRLTIRNQTVNSTGHSWLALSSARSPAGVGFEVDNVLVNGSFRYKAWVGGPPARATYSTHYQSESPLGTVYGSCAGGGLPVTCISSAPAGAGADVAEVRRRTAGVK